MNGELLSEGTDTVGLEDEWRKDGIDRSEHTVYRGWNHWKRLEGKWFL